MGVLGMVFTALVQSSSVTTGLTILLVQHGISPWRRCPVLRPGAAWQKNQ
jgi:Na+/phosphate symporter